MPQVYISTNDFLFRSNPLFPYIFFSILALEIIAGLCISLYFVQLKKKEGVVGVQYYNIKKQYLYAAIGMCLPAVGLAIFLLIRFFAIFPIGDNLQSIPSIVLFMLLVTALGLTGVALFYSFKDLNTSIFCPVGSHYDPTTLQCYAGCNGDDSNCNPGEVCLGNQCCPNDEICNKATGACCPAAECQTDPTSGQKYCCPAESVCPTKDGTAINCCGTGTVCDKESGACVATCGASLICKPGQYCYSFPEVSAEAVDGIFCPYPESKLYDTETSTLYCCFGNPKPEDCAAQDTPLRVPGETGNYTACFSTLDVDPVDITALYEANNDDAFNKAGTKIMSHGKNTGKLGYMCGYDGPLKRGYQSIYSSSESGTCKDKQGLCNNDATTRTEQMRGTLSDDGKTLYCTQTIACNTQTGNTPGMLASGYPSQYQQSYVICNDNLCTLMKDDPVSFKNPDDLASKSPSVGSSPSSSASYVFQPDCTNYPEITDSSGQECKGTDIDKLKFQCAAQGDAYKWIQSITPSKNFCVLQSNGTINCQVVDAGAAQNYIDQGYAECTSGGQDVCNRLGIPQPTWISGDTESNFRTGRKTAPYCWCGSSNAECHTVAKIRNGDPDLLICPPGSCAVASTQPPWHPLDKCDDKSKYWTQTHFYCCDKIGLQQAINAKGSDVKGTIYRIVGDPDNATVSQDILDMLGAHCVEGTFNDLYDGDLQPYMSILLGPDGDKRCTDNSGDCVGRSHSKPSWKDTLYKYNSKNIFGHEL